MCLTLIYVELNGATTALSRQLVEMRFDLAGEFIMLGKLLNAPETADKLVEANVAAYREMTPRYYINVGFRTLMWLIVVWKLLAVTVLASN